MECLITRCCAVINVNISQGTSGCTLQQPALQRIGLQRPSERTVSQRVCLNGLNNCLLFHGQLVCCLQITNQRAARPLSQGFTPKRGAGWMEFIQHFSIKMVTKLTMIQCLLALGYTNCISIDTEALRCEFPLRYCSLSSLTECCTPLYQLCFSAGTQSQLNLEHSKSRMGTFIEGGPMADTNPDEGY